MNIKEKLILRMLVVSQLCFLLIAPYTSFSQKAFKTQATELGLSYRIPKGFKKIDTPESYNLVDSTRFSKTRLIDPWSERLKCKQGWYYGHSYRIINKRRNVIITYSLLAYPNFNKNPGSYESQLRSFEKYDDSKSSVVKFTAEFVNKTYGANDGGIYYRSCDCNPHGFNNIKVLYLTRRAKDNGLTNADLGSSISLAFQYTDEMIGDIDEIIAQTSKSLQYVY